MTYPFLNDFSATFPKTYYKFTVCFAKLKLFISNFSTLIKKWWSRAPFALNDEPPLQLTYKWTDSKIAFKKWCHYDPVAVCMTCEMYAIIDNITSYSRDSFIDAQLAHYCNVITELQKLIILYQSKIFNSTNKSVSKTIKPIFKIPIPGTEDWVQAQNRRCAMIRTFFFFWTMHQGKTNVQLPVLWAWTWIQSSGPRLVFLNIGLSVGIDKQKC